MRPVIRPEIWTVATTEINDSAQPSRCCGCSGIENFRKRRLPYVSPPRFRDAKSIKHHSVVGERMLREAAIRQNQPGNAILDQPAAPFGPPLTAIFRFVVAIPCQPTSPYKEPRGFTGPVIVVLRHRIKRSASYTLTVRLNECRKPGSNVFFEPRNS